MVLSSEHYNGPRITMMILPTHMLGSFALELFLKAWLLGSGTEKARVRDFGHDLRKLYAAAKKHGLPDISSLHEVVELFDAPHGDFVFRYIESGTIVTPANWPMVIPIMDILDTEVDELIGASASKGLQPGH